MSPKLKLIEYTGKGRPDEQIHAAHLLIFTKATRLNMTPDLLAAVQTMDEAEITAELNYMSKTIPSSWEFVDTTFLISDVTRACAQQMTRTRSASYAMQSQRVVDMTGAAVTNPCASSVIHAKAFEGAANYAVRAYKQLIENGAAREQARGLLPMNTVCNLVAKYNLRSLVELVRARRSMRTQSEYGNIVRLMEEEVLKAWPWAAPFFESKAHHALEILQEVVEELGIKTGEGTGWKVAKAMDLIR